MWRAAKLVVSSDYSAYLEARAVGASGLDFQRESVWISEGNPASNAVALTFDDGPTPGVTEAILEAFHKRKGQATFFSVGERVRSFPQVTRRAFAEGHEVANHTYTHCRCPRLGTAELRQEVLQCQEAIAEVIGQPASYFRSPFAAFREDQQSLATEMGMRVVFWNGNSRDWRHPGAEAIAHRVKKLVRPGAIIVMHDKHPQTAEAIGSILEYIDANGLVCKKLSDVL